MGAAEARGALGGAVRRAGAWAKLKGGRESGSDQRAAEIGVRAGGQSPGSELGVRARGQSPGSEPRGLTPAVTRKPLLHVREPPLLNHDAHPRRHHGLRHGDSSRGPVDVPRLPHNFHFHHEPRWSDGKLGA